MRSRN